MSHRPARQTTKRGEGGSHGLIGAHEEQVRALQTENDRLREALRAREDILSLVAHDLQNPLSVIVMVASTLLRRLSDHSERRSVEVVMRAARRLNWMVRDLLSIDAIDDGRFAIRRGEVEPAEVILAALDSQQNLAAAASIILATDLSPELPPIEADGERLLEVLENLVGNAAKFSSRGGSITVGAKAQDGDVLFWVKDGGAGIPPDQVQHVFDRFWQARNAKREGNGLGLHICKAIVEAHGGRIWAESSLGVETTMFFTIPASTLRALPEEGDAEEVSSILLVDDRPENLVSLKAILERPDYRLVTATSGQEALSLTLREDFSLALIDIAMPVMTGIEVAVHLKELERSRDIPIVFVTAFGDDPQEIHRAYSAGGADYLVKPLDPEIVRKKVAVFVDLNRRIRKRKRPVSPTP